MGHLFLNRGADRGDGHRRRLRTGEIGAVPGVAHQRRHDRGQAHVLAVVQMVGLGRREKDAFHPLAAKKRAQPAVPAGAKGRKDARHRLPHILDRAGAGMDRAQHIDQHHLPVDAGEMVVEERLYHLGLVGLIAPLHLAPERSARDGSGVGQGREGQDR